MSVPYICAACGTQFAEATCEPARCPICEDSRAFGVKVGKHQRWTSLAQLRTRHRSRIREIDPGVISIVMEPQFSVSHQCIPRSRRRRKRPVGLHQSDRRCDDRSRTRAGRRLGHRDFPSSLLRIHGRVEPRVWKRPHLPSRRRSRVGAPGRPRRDLLGRRQPAAERRVRPRPLRGPFRRRDCPRLGGSRGSPGSPSNRRHDRRAGRSRERHLHAQLSKADSVACVSDPPHRRGDRALRVRPDLWVLAPEPDPRRREAGGSSFGRAIHRACCLVSRASGARVAYGRGPRLRKYATRSAIWPVARRSPSGVGHSARYSAGGALAHATASATARTAEKGTDPFS